MKELLEFKNLVGVALLVLLVSFVIALFSNATVAKDIGSLLVFVFFIRLIIFASELL